MRSYTLNLQTAGFPRLADDAPSSGRSSTSNTDADSPLTLHGAPLLFAATPGWPTDAVAEQTFASRIWASVRQARRVVGEEEVPYLTLLILRLVRAVPGAQYLLHPRVVFFLGGVAVVAPSVAFTVLEKLIADDLGFHFPVLMQVLVLGMAALLVELFTGQHALFVRAGAVPTARLLPLAALFALSLVLSHTARQFNSVHGTFQVLQALLPVAVIATVSAFAHSPRPDMSLRRVPASTVQIHRALSGVQVSPPQTMRARSGSGSHSGSCISVHRSAAETDDDLELGKGGYLSGNSSASSFGGLALSDDSTTMDAPLQHQLRDCVHSGRRLAVVIGCLAALATWSPSYMLVGISNAQLLSIPSLRAMWVRSALNTGLSLASVLCQAALLVGIASQLKRQPTQSPTAFVRHFAPLCMLAVLALWPLLERPVDALAELDTRRLLSCVGVATLGALSWIARIAMLRAEMADGAVGVAVVMQIKPLVCLGIGWWAFGYVYWWAQIAAFVAACACVLVWVVVRMALTAYPELVPVISPHMYRSARTRKRSEVVA
ncbi:hypothetical protein IWW55_001335 [Coemansia sp. RSA 2706]|nr:hypothetical protein IWW55_001335 [Coemansia sp. RSA 2706]KAJ2315342.1 hypothetical protein IWW54_000348 [Coemansia sp. RSA 2705]